MLIAPNNWGELQHYKDRNPPWIKLHKKLLDNFDFQSLPVASRALAPMLWLLASEHENGVIDAAPEKLAFRLRMGESAAKDALKPLIDKQFFSVLEGDIAALATRKQGAMPETEEEKRESRDRQARDFKIFYDAYPKKKAPADAEKAFAKVDVSIEIVLHAIAEQRKSDDWQKEGGRYIPYPATWLNQRQWENAVGEIAASVPAHASASAALAKLDADKTITAPPSAEIRERMAKLRQGAAA
jgi:hypothetical protein